MIGKTPRMTERRIEVDRAIAAEPTAIETNLRATLGILARTVAPGRPRPGA
jgi:hypothetical protein